MSMLNLDYLKVFAVVDLLEMPIYWTFFASLARSTQPTLSGGKVPSRVKTIFIYPAISGGSGQGSEIRHFVKIAGLVTLVNLCTHPVVFFGFMSSGRTIFKSVLWGQAFSMATEAILISWAARLPFGQTIVASIAANLFSWQLSALVIYWLLM
jgi:hypothetical protein